MAAAQLPSSWSDDTDVLEMDHFVKTISGMQAKGVRPDLIGSIIAHYSSKWLPDLAPLTATTTVANFTSSKVNANSSAIVVVNDRGGCSTATQSPIDDDDDDSLKKKKKKKKRRFFVETLMGILPTEPRAVPCYFLLGLLRVGSMVGADHLDELEGRIACQLDQAEVKDLLIIPNFSSRSSSSSTLLLLDVELVIRLVRRFLSSLDYGAGSENDNSRVALVKVARLVDSYLAEAALNDPNLGLGEFIRLAGVLPEYSRINHDGLYRAVDTYLKVHPNMTKQERKLLCRLIDTRKFSPDASLHAANNDRLPVRTVLQVLISEQTKLAHQLDRHIICCYHHPAKSASFNAAAAVTSSSAAGPIPAASASARCLPSSRRPSSSSFHTAQQQQQLAEETIRTLKDDLLRVQLHCDVMGRQMETLCRKVDHRPARPDKKGAAGGFFGKWWWKIGMLPPSFRKHNNAIIDGGVEIEFSDDMVHSGILKYYVDNYGGDSGGDTRLVNDRTVGSLVGSRRCNSMDVTKDLITRARVATKRWRHSSS